MTLIFFKIFEVPKSLKYSKQKNYIKKKKIL